MRAKEARFITEHSKRGVGHILEAVYNAAHSGLDYIIVSKRRIEDDHIGQLKDLGYQVQDLGNEYEIGW